MPASLKFVSKTSGSSGRCVILSAYDQTATAVRARSAPAPLPVHASAAAAHRSLSAAPRATSQSTAMRGTAGGTSPAPPHYAAARGSLPPDRCAFAAASPAAPPLRTTRAGSPCAAPRTVHACACVTRGAPRASAS